MLKLRKNKKGFTLVELIVVIAIMAILAGTVAGVVVSTQQNAKNSAASSSAETLAKQIVLLLGNPSDYVVATMPAAATQTAFCAITVSDADTPVVVAQFNAAAIATEIAKDDNYSKAIGNLTAPTGSETIGTLSTAVPKAGTNQYSVNTISATDLTGIVVSFAKLGGSNKYKTTYTITVDYANDQFKIA